MKIKEITDKLETYFPLSLQMSYDNCGLQIGDVNQEVDKMLICLTLDHDVIEEAISQDIHFILCHHPFFFNGCKCIDLNSNDGKIIQNCISHHITVYALHTCLDIGLEESMNLWIADRLGIQDAIKTMDDLVVEGTLDTNTLDLCQKLKDTCHLEGVRYNINQKIHSIAVCGGSGAEYIEPCINHVDCLITGDIKYHEMQKAYENGLVVIDAGHFLENIMIDYTAKLIENIDIRVYKSNQKDYYHYI